MNGRRLPSLVFAGLALLALGFLMALLWPFGRSPVVMDAPAAVAAPHAFAGPVEGGCYRPAVSTCAIHIDQWQNIVTDPGRQLLGFRLLAKHGDEQSAMVLYDFSTDQSNPPVGTYRPSLVRQDFAAECGAEYTLHLLARDSGDLDFEEVGRTNEFVCPAAPTPTPSVTPTATEIATETPTPTTTVLAPTATATTEPADGLLNYLPIVMR